MIYIFFSFKIKKLKYYRLKYNMELSAVILALLLVIAVFELLFIFKLTTELVYIFNNFSY